MIKNLISKIKPFIKNWFKYFIYISIIFLTIFLIKTDHLKIPEITSFPYLFTSLFLLLTGFLFWGISWGVTLNKYDYNIKLLDGIISCGLSIFGKYIPGKVWTIIGRSGYINKKYSYSQKDLSIISLTAQFIELWTGLSLGTIGLFLFGGIKLYGIPVLILWCILTLVIFTNLPHKLTEKLIYKIFKKEFKIPYISISKSYKVIFFYILTWLFWSAGFYFLIKSIYITSSIDLNIIIGLGFPIATTLGIMAIIFPGGLGVREGLLVMYLTLSGFNNKDALVISATSRLWFLSGEIFIFVIGFILDKKYNKKSIQQNKEVSNDGEL